MREEKPGRCLDVEAGNQDKIRNLPGCTRPDGCKLDPPALGITAVPRRPVHPASAEKCDALGEAVAAEWALPGEADAHVSDRVDVLSQQRKRINTEDGDPPGASQPAADAGWQNTMAFSLPVGMSMRSILMAAEPPSMQDARLHGANQSGRWLHSR